MSETHIMPIACLCYTLKRWQKKMKPRTVTQLQERLRDISRGQTCELSNFERMNANSDETKFAEAKVWNNVTQSMVIIYLIPQNTGLWRCMSAVMPWGQGTKNVPLNLSMQKEQEGKCEDYCSPGWELSRIFVCLIICAIFPANFFVMIITTFLGQGVIFSPGIKILVCEDMPCKVWLPTVIVVWYCRLETENYVEIRHFFIDLFWFVIHLHC